MDAELIFALGVGLSWLGVWVVWRIQTIHGRESEGRAQATSASTCGEPPQEQEPERGLRVALRDSPSILYALENRCALDLSYVSANVQDRLGYEAHELTASSELWWERIHPEDRKRVLENLARLPHGARGVQEFRFRHKDGRYRWLMDLSRAGMEPDEATRFLGHWLDITELRQSQTQLRQSADRWRRLLLDLPLLVVACDRVARIVAWNDACEQWTGFRREEVLGQPSENYPLFASSLEGDPFGAVWSDPTACFHNLPGEVPTRRGSRQPVLWSRISAEHPVPGWTSWTIGVPVPDQGALPRN